ncbi:MAG: recombinase family protein [Bacteroidales bacterium]|nr:recombinase family protein [Bacteroidales bacterium]
MAKLGYIMIYDQYPSLDADRKWMEDYGCDPIVEERQGGKLRPRWREVMKRLGSGDDLVIPRLSNVVSGTAELAFFLDHCRREKIHLIAFNDRVDSLDVIFPQKSTAEFFALISGIPDEVAAIRNAEKHISSLRRIRQRKTATEVNKRKRDKVIINLYTSGAPIDQIWKASGFRSRSSVFRVLRDNNIPFNRGHSPEQRATKRDNPSSEGHPENTNH